MSEITGYECRFVHYATSLQNPDDDAVFVKEIVHHTDGTTAPNLRMIENYKVPYWIVQKGFRTYKEKKESEEVKKCIRLEANYARLPMAITRALGKPLKSRLYLKEVLDDPYVYGADTTPAVWIKNGYNTKWSKLNSPWKVAAYDIEYDVVDKSPERCKGIILACITIENIGVSYQFINKKFIAETPENIQRLHDTYKLYAGEEMEEFGIKEIKFIFVDESAEVAAELLRKAHELKPDIMSAWNHHYDLTTMCREMDEAGYDLGDVFSDPSVPNRYRKFRFKEGQRIRVTAAGKNMNLGFQELWHTVYAPAHFVFLDAMACYYHIRKAKGQMASYGLNDTLIKEIGVGKMTFDKLKVTDAEKWHHDMQKYYPFEYAVYNWYDCHRMNRLEAHTNDLGISMPALVGVSEFENFPKQPRMLADKFTFICLDRGEVPGTSGRNMVGELDQHLPSIKGWIVTLDTQLVLPTLGIPIFRNLPNIPSQVYVHVADK